MVDRHQREKVKKKFEPIILRHEIFNKIFA